MLLIGLAVALPVAAFGTVAWYYNDHSMLGAVHQDRECATAAELASETLTQVSSKARKLREDRLPVLKLVFDPKLEGISPAGSDAALPDIVPESLRPYFVTSRALDCSVAFSSKHLPIGRVGGLPIRPGNTDVMFFSRIVFSDDGEYAYVERSGVCGGLCGSGWDTRWHRQNGKWILDKSTMHWMS